MVNEKAALLVCETVHNLGRSRIARLVRLQLLHYLLGARDCTMETPPHLLRLVHEGVFLAYLNPRHDLFPLQDFSVLLGQLEHLVR